MTPEELATHCKMKRDPEYLAGFADGFGTAIEGIAECSDGTYYWSCGWAAGRDAGESARLAGIKIAKPD